MIYTGNYYNCKSDICISISGDRGKGANFNGKYFSELAPKLNFWKIWHSNIGILTEEENTRYYIRQYYNLVLSKLNQKEIFNKLDNSILLCYENNLEFCHRFLVAFWLEKTLGIKVPEVKISKTGNLIELERPEFIKNLFLDELKEVL